MMTDRSMFDVCSALSDLLTAVFANMLAQLQARDPGDQQWFNARLGSA